MRLGLPFGIVSYRLISNTTPHRGSRDHENIRRHNLYEKRIAGAGGVLNVTRRQVGVVVAREDFLVQISWHNNCQYCDPRFPIQLSILVA